MLPVEISRDLSLRTTEPQYCLYLELAVLIPRPQELTLVFNFKISTTVHSVRGLIV